MHKIFVPLYRFFSKHKPLMYIILACTTVLFLCFGLRLHYEEDISKLLPSSSVESQLAFTSASTTPLLLKTDNDSLSR